LETNKKVPGLQGAAATGIGVYCHLQEHGTSTMVFVQASTEKMPSVLQAESTALLLAASVDNALNLQEVTFLTDNSTLAAAVASTDAPHSFRFLGRFGNTLLIISRSHILSSLHPTIFHVKRNFNGVGHNCAHLLKRRCSRQFLRWN
jgi:hypothetical protein